ncbi:MAG: glycosyltransferase family 4 protein [Bryobacteraceae bacterium]|nr:glycosyltransferase family 4 protein [Bryobacteraceae bacterium]
MKPAALVLYHYLYPDDVVSAVHLTELCTGLVERGWEVTASACNRACRDESKSYEPETVWKGVRFRRLWRPRFRQSSALGRMANAVWMVGRWSLMALDPRVRADVLIVGTDPIFSPVAGFAWRMFRRRTRLVHWCFDLYPEAAVADGLLREGSGLVRVFQALMGMAYRRYHLIVDIGGCMRGLLAQYGSRAAVETVVPWALSEPEGPAPAAEGERRGLFGDASLCLLYSGNFGRAHTWTGVLELAQALAPRGGAVVFSVRGNAVEDLQRAVAAAGAPVRFAGFASPEALEQRLAATDIHIVTLKPEWTGTVVPSKFFGALAIGRPVLFVGSGESAVAKWIRRFDVGWVLEPGREQALADELVRWSASDEARRQMFERCHEVYRREFSLASALDRWDRALRALL